MSHFGSDPERQARRYQPSAGPRVRSASRWGVVVGHEAAEEGPEGGAVDVVVANDMGEFVGDDVVDQGEGGLDDAPVQADPRVADLGRFAEERERVTGLAVERAALDPVGRRIGELGTAGAGAGPHGVDPGPGQDRATGEPMRPKLVGRAGQGGRKKRPERRPARG